MFLQSHRETADKCKMFQVGRVVSADFVKVFPSSG